MVIADNSVEKLKGLIGAKVLPLALGLVLSMSALGVFAQVEAGAAQKPAPQPAPIAPEPSSGDADAVAGSDSLPLRNVELLNRLDEDRLPTRPRRFLKQRFRQVRRAKDEQILQLLLICVGFVGAFIAILALRSMPPSRGQSQ